VPPATTVSVTAAPTDMVIDFGCVLMAGATVDATGRTTGRRITTCLPLTIVVTGT
jgi:hypothetical protein